MYLRTTHIQFKVSIFFYMTIKLKYVGRDDGQKLSWEIPKSMFNVC